MNQKLIEILEESKRGMRLGIDMIGVGLRDYPCGALPHILDAPPGQKLVIVSNLVEAHQMAHWLFAAGVTCESLRSIDNHINQEGLGYFAFNQMEALVADYTTLTTLPPFLGITSAHVFVEVDEDFFVALVGGMTYRLERKYPDTLYVQYLPLEATDEAGN